MVVDAQVMTPPKKRFDPERFWAIGRGLRRRPGTTAAIDRAMQAMREGVDVSAYFTNVSRRPVVSRMSLVLRPGSGLLR
jgi:hypothetical protein